MRTNKVNLREKLELFEEHESVTFGPGEMVIVPAGVVHRPAAAKNAI